jgi:radical SAM-linked protein
MTEEALSRYRLHFSKGKQLRYIGHLDLHRTLERTLRRANLPLDYSKGFNPRIKLNLSTALPLGCSSSAELADIWLISDLDVEAVLQAVISAAPPGLSFTSVEKIDLRIPSLQSQINAVEYQVELLDVGVISRLDDAVETLLNATALARTRRGKEYDLRPLIQSLEAVQQPPNPPSLRMVLTSGEGTTGRPEEVILALDLDPAEALIERTQLFLAEEADKE